MQKGTLPGIATGTTLAPGAVVSSRFLIEGLTTILGNIVVYNAKDQRTQRGISLWAIPPGVVRPDVVNATRSAVKSATALPNKDLVVPFGSSTDPAGTLFIATEPLGASTVSDLIEKKRKEQATFSVSAAFEYVVHAINGLSAVHATMAHGAVAPNLMRIDPDGRTRLAGLGLVAPLMACKSVAFEYLAPEVRKGLSPTPRSDIYSLGAMMFEMCTGRTYDGKASASSIVPGLPAAFDIVLETCLAESPDDRFETVAEIKGALSSLASPTIHPPPSNDSGDVPVEFDVDFDAAPPPARPLPPAPPPRRAAPPPAAHSVGARMSLAEKAPAPSIDLPSSNSVDLKGLLDEATANDAPRWMFVRGGLDHGPLSARELIQAIVKSEVTEDDVVFNMDSGERKKLTAWAQYREFAEQARQKRRLAQHAREVKSAVAEESVSTKAKASVAVALVAMVAIIGVAYYKTLGPGRSLEKRQAEFNDALAHGQLHLSEGGLQVLPAPPPSSVGGHHGGGGGGGGSYGSYEAAMNAPIEFNFGGSGPSGGTLSDHDIAAPLNANLSRFGSCATAEMARGGSVRAVQMRIAVGGTGAPIGVSVASGSGAFKGCVSGVVHSIRWRAFGGPRVGFAWGFSLE